MRKRTVQRILFVLMLLPFGYIIGAVSKNQYLAYNRAEYEFISFDPIRLDKTGNHQRGARQIAEQLELAEEQLDKDG